jgi:hypothetical protein
MKIKKTYLMRLISVCGLYCSLAYCFVMAADLHIHVFARDELTDDDFRCFFANTLGSRWSSQHNAPLHLQKKVNAGYDLTDRETQQWREATEPPCEDRFICEHWERIKKTESVWVGEFSWLKAALHNADELYVPDFVKLVQDAIDEDLPQIDDQLIDKIRQGRTLPNKTVHPDVMDGKGYSLEKVREVVSFLSEHRGKRAFTIGW